MAWSMRSEVCLIIGGQNWNCEPHVSYRMLTMPHACLLLTKESYITFIYCSKLRVYLPEQTML